MPSGQCSLVMALFSAKPIASESFPTQVAASFSVSSLEMKLNCCSLPKKFHWCLGHETGLFGSISTSFLGGWTWDQQALDRSCYLYYLPIPNLGPPMLPAFSGSGIFLQLLPLWSGLEQSKETWLPSQLTWTNTRLKEKESLGKNRNTSPSDPELWNHTVQTSSPEASIGLQVTPLNQGRESFTSTFSIWSKESIFH